METFDLIIAASLDNFPVTAKYRAYIIILDGKVYKNLLDLPNETILELSKTPKALQALIDQHKTYQAKIKKIAKEELKDSDMSHLSSFVKIDITGITGSGKSNIALLIYDTLKLHGLITNISDEDLLYDDIQLMRTQRTTILENIAERTGVKISTQALRKDNQEHLKIS